MLDTRVSKLTAFAVFARLFFIANNPSGCIRGIDSLTLRQTETRDYD